MISTPTNPMNPPIAIANPEDDIDLKRDETAITPSYRAGGSKSIQTPCRAREHTSDVLDSVQILSIPFEEEQKLIREYFPHRIPLPDQPNSLGPDQSEPFERHQCIMDLHYPVLEYTMNVNDGPESPDLRDRDCIRVCFKCQDHYPNQVCIRLTKLQYYKYSVQRRCTLIWIIPHVILHSDCE